MFENCSHGRLPDKTSNVVQTQKSFDIQVSRRLEIILINMKIKHEHKFFFSYIHLFSMYLPNKNTLSLCK